MENLSLHFQELFTLSGALALGNIILIDLVMSGDNAVLIGMATKNLTGTTRKKAILFWVILATVLRIILATFAVLLLEIKGVSFAGWILLLWVVWKFYRDVRFPSGHYEESSKGVSGFWAAIGTIVLADLSMSLDNVLAVAWAANENLVFLGIGLVVSIALMALASSLIAKYLDRFPIIQWLGLLVILFVAFRMVVEGGETLIKETHSFYWMPVFMAILWGAFVFVQQHSCIKIAKKAPHVFWSKKRANMFGGGIVFGLLLGAAFFHSVQAFFVTSESIAYSLIFILLAVILEIVNGLWVASRQEGCPID